MFLSGLKSRQVDSVELPSIRCDSLNMQHQDFNIIFQPPNEATSILCCSFFILILTVLDVAISMTVSSATRNMYPLVTIMIYTLQIESTNVTTMDIQYYKLTCTCSWSLYMYV